MTELTITNRITCSAGNHTGTDACRVLRHLVSDVVGNGQRLTGVTCSNQTATCKAFMLGTHINIVRRRGTQAITAKVIVDFFYQLKAFSTIFNFLVNRHSHSHEYELNRLITLTRYSVLNGVFVNYVLVHEMGLPQIAVMFNQLFDFGEFFVGIIQRNHQTQFNQFFLKFFYGGRHYTTKHFFALQYHQQATSHQITRPAIFFKARLDQGTHQVLRTYAFRQPLNCTDNNSGPIHTVFKFIRSPLSPSVNFSRIPRFNCTIQFNYFFNHFSKFLTDGVLPRHTIS